MTVTSHAPHTNATTVFSTTPDDLRREARATGQEVWEQVSGMNVYTSLDRPGLVRTREEVRAHRNTLMIHTSSDAMKAPF